jgi:hypothetical protein
MVAYEYIIPCEREKSYHKLLCNVRFQSFRAVKDWFYVPHLMDSFFHWILDIFSWSNMAIEPEKSVHPIICKIIVGHLIYPLLDTKVAATSNAYSIVDTWLYVRVNEWIPWKTVPFDLRIEVVSPVTLKTEKSPSGRRKSSTFQPMFIKSYRKIVTLTLLRKGH